MRIKCVLEKPAFSVGFGLTEKWAYVNITICFYVVE